MGDLINSSSDNYNFLGFLGFCSFRGDFLSFDGILGLLLLLVFNFIILVWWLFSTRGFVNFNHIVMLS